MVSQKWQRKHPVIQHIALGLSWGLPLFWLSVDLSSWSKVALIIGTWIVVIPISYYLNNLLAEKLIRVFKHEEDAVTGIVQRSLTKNYIRFSRRFVSDETHFEIRDQGLTLVIESYPLNLPIDSHIVATDATKIEIRGLTKSNSALAERITLLINQSAELRFRQA